MCKNSWRAEKMQKVLSNKLPIIIIQFVRIAEAYWEAYSRAPLIKWQLTKHRVDSSTTQVLVELVNAEITIV